VVAPGAAARRGVPADRQTEIRAELAPVFGALAEIDLTVERIRDEARDDADRALRAGRERADSLVAEARSRAEADRARVVAAGRARAAAAEARLVRGAEVDAAKLRERARDAMPGLVERTTARALAELSELTGSVIDLAGADVSDANAP
jgi:hypothetical protein